VIAAKCYGQLLALKPGKQHPLRVRPALHHPHGPRDSRSPEVLKLKQIAKQLSRAPGYDDSVRLGNPLQPCREFSDLVGSTALSARMDPEDLREIISAYQKSVAETVRAGLELIVAVTALKAPVSLQTRIG
jgi:class 3 adenylate cyclase